MKCSLCVRRACLGRRRATRPAAVPSQDKSIAPPDGITVASFEREEIGPDLYRAACGMALKGAGLEARAMAESG